LIAIASIPLHGVKENVKLDPSELYKKNSGNVLSLDCHIYGPHPLLEVVIGNGER